ncbi:right-handed parallel beta-helix repeat-containing protein [Fodinicola feengrottensis]
MKSTFATIAVALTVAALVMPVPAEAAPRMLYVDNTDGSGCSDVGRGTQQQPFCTIQVAADTVVPGTTVDITGEYQESVTVGRSGTPRAPIVFQSENRNFTWVDGTSGGPAFTMHGVHDVVIRALSIAGGSVDHDAIFITGSQRVIVDSNALSIPSPEAQGSVVRVTGASRSITVSRNLIDSSYGYAAIRIDSAGVGNVVSANDISGGGNTGVRVADSPAAAVTGNTVIHSCNRGVEVTGRSSGASVQNNIFAYVFGSEVYYHCPPSTEITEISVDSAAVASGITVDFNIVFPYSENPPYRWAGRGFQSTADFTAATGQGRHDLNVDPGFTFGGGPALAEGSPAIDSANAQAPGQLQTDVYYWDTRVDDPLVANTGTNPGYHDRGAWEFQDPFSLWFEASDPTGPRLNMITMTAHLEENAWSSGLTYTYDFGDGSPPVSTPATTYLHTYTAPGEYVINVSYAATSGRKGTTSLPVTIGPHS